VLLDNRVALRIPDVCRLTGLGRTSIYQAIALGDLVARKCGRSTVILAVDLDEFLNNLPSAREKNERGER
jgi:predicted DNA-binding transcriptional regulator AlpA